MFAEANVMFMSLIQVRYNKYKAEYLENLMLFPADCIKALKNLGTNGHNYYLSDADIFNMAGRLSIKAASWKTDAH